MNILEVYKKYQIMPQLMEHQFTVAAVGKLICENFILGTQVDSVNIITACLLHDMGNIVKFDLSQTDKLYPKLLSSEREREYWQNVKQEFREKYGSSSHEATKNIVEELGISPRVKELVVCVGFEQGIQNAATSDFGKKICAYSDMRVGPLGVVYLEERLADLRVRYQNHPEGGHNREDFEAALRQIEKQIFEHCPIKPEVITSIAVEGFKNKLKSFNL